MALLYFHALNKPFGHLLHCNIIIGTNIDSICKSYVILSIRYIPRNSIGFINRIPRYIRDRLLYT